MTVYKIGREHTEFSLTEKASPAIPISNNDDATVIIAGAYCILHYFTYLQKSSVGETSILSLQRKQ